MPHGWENALAVIAKVFRTQPSELWALDVEELLFWLERAEWVSKRHG